MTSKTIFTLVFVKKHNDVLLGLKTRGLGVGLWNGFGGKVENDESIVEGAKRELMEECSLQALDLKQLGVVVYEENDDQNLSVVHIFTTQNFKGDLKASEEMNPVKWFNSIEIPYQKMWPDAKSWHPYMLNDKLFSAFVSYGADGKIKEKKIKEFSNLRTALNSIL